LIRFGYYASGGGGAATAAAVDANDSVAHA